MQAPPRWGGVCLPCLRWGGGHHDRRDVLARSDAGAGLDRDDAGGQLENRPAAERAGGVARASRVAKRTAGARCLCGACVRACRGGACSSACVGGGPLTTAGGLLLERTVFVVGTVSVTLALATLAAQAVGVYGAALAPALPASSLTRNIAWMLMATLGLLVLMSGLGLSITPMLTALGVGGLGVALALQEPLGNFSPARSSRSTGRFGPATTSGWIPDRRAMSPTSVGGRLRMLPNNLVVVPNAKLAQAIVTNHHLPSKDLAGAGGGRGGLFERSVPRRGCGRRVRRQVMADVPGGVPDFEPFIGYHTFAESSVNFTVILRAREFVDQYLVKHDFIKRLRTSFIGEGIVVPFPIRTIAGRPEPVGSR